MSSSAATAVSALPRDNSKVPVSAIRHANGDKSIFIITLDVSNFPELVASYTTPGQRVQISLPFSGLDPAYMDISSVPRTGARIFELLVRSVPGTTAERLCKLSVGDHVELGAVTGLGLPIQCIVGAETVLYFAVAEGLRYVLN
jgi:NAD(P)H-flavin reductase